LTIREHLDAISNMPIKSERRNNGKKETYFIVYDWTEPYSRKTYTRVVISIWKIALIVMIALPVPN
jgi:hypothetical protein